MSGRPRLLVATPDFPPAKGGIQLLMARLAEHVDAFDVRVVSFRGPPGPRPVPARVGLRRVVPRPEHGHKAAVAALNADVTAVGLRWRPDVVLCGYVTLSPGCRALQSLRGTPYVQVVHAEEFRVRPAVSAGAVRAAAATVAVSRHTRDLALAAGAPPERVHLQHPGVDLPGRWTAVRDPDRPTLVTVARLDAGHKGHAVVLEALVRIARRVPDVRWTVVGAGSPAPLQAAARRLGVADRITWAVDVDDAERDRHLDDATVFVLPSRLPPGGLGGEGFGIAFLEAGAHGLPVIGPDRGGPCDAFRAGLTGLGIDPTDADALADAVATLLLDPARAQALGTEGRAWAQDHSWPATAAAVQRILLDVLDT